MKKFTGFTLIELLVAVSILAILSTVGLVSFQSVRNKANDAKIRVDLDSIKKAYEQNFDPSGNGGQGGYKALTDSMFASGKIPTKPDGTQYTCEYGPDPAPGSTYGCISTGISQGFKVTDGTAANVVSNTGGTLPPSTTTATCSKFVGTSQTCNVWKRPSGTTNAVPCDTSTIYINCSDIPTGPAIDCEGVNSNKSWIVPYYYTQQVGGTAISLNPGALMNPPVSPPGNQDNTIWQASHGDLYMFNSGCSVEASVEIKLHTSSQ